MYVPMRDNNQVIINFPWEGNTAKGFVISVIIVILLILLLSSMKIDILDDVYDEKGLIPVEIINFGAGDGTGMSKGNLSKEGMLHKGSKLMSQLEDAAIAAKMSKSKNNLIDDPENYKNLKGAPDIASDSKNTIQDPGNASKNTGSPDGTRAGTGTGTSGYGPGAGEGYGDIEWGGGGNRVVLSKILPKYPSGTNAQAQIKIKFTVSAEGYVMNMFPLQKADPILERSAMEALKKWKFNKLKDNREMYGIITFTFKLS